MEEEIMEERPFVAEMEFYQPSTDDTREAYQALLSLIEYQLGTRPQSIMCIAAHEILSVLKDNTITDPVVQKVEIEKLLKPIDYSVFDQLVVIAANITDYRHGVEPPQQYYEPKSVGTSKAYKLLLDVIQSHLGPQSLIQLHAIAYQILMILKDGNVYEKKMMIEEYMKNVISIDTFHFLVFIGGLITDFGDFKSGESGVVRIGSASVSEIWGTSGRITPRAGELDPRGEKRGDREDGHDSNVGEMGEDSMVCDEDEHEELATGVKDKLLADLEKLSRRMANVVINDCSGTATARSVWV